MFPFAAMVGAVAVILRFPAWKLKRDENVSSPAGEQGTLPGREIQGRYGVSG